ncbi:cation:proton antiporter [Clostridium tetani]|uniref:hydrogenase subunit MbhD domain-containing protein n=1 Tax=Clostridium tetani TaxID=1513 RepID=UPI00100B5C7B|nr:hydrogenase subunit MbhD domain-containing protein [Clostridium tetani]RXM79508.1 cation:proton antiporter [Clostridium tetani]RYV00320.1 cation:proton antiporter [Clostridium tetani]
MKIFSIIMLLFLIASSVAVSYIKDLLGAVIIFTVYSLIMAILWQQLNAPDLAITEAAVGAVITTILFVITLSRVRGAKK